MDVGDPSNFVRLLNLFNSNLPSIQHMITGYSISDETTKKTIQKVFANQQYLLDPHGAVGYNALLHYLEKDATSAGIFLETAHPVKFYEVVETVIDGNVPVPKAVQHLFKKTKKSIKMQASPEELKSFLMDRKQ
jgi:threonine synthase